LVSGSDILSSSMIEFLVKNILVILIIIFVIPWRDVCHSE
jgi:hypothetical protein